MVTITGFEERKRKDGTFFTALTITGNVELVQSTNTGKFYATIRKTSIPSTFDSSIAEGLIGTQLRGDIVRVKVDPYNFVDKRTGAMIQLQHSYSFKPEGSTELIGAQQVEALEMA